jgi:hypothetical protein
MSKHDFAKKWQNWHFFDVFIVFASKNGCVKK